MQMPNEAKEKTVTAMLPVRLHHNAFVVADQERTRHFYEDIIGLPLRATWIEVSENIKGEVFCHSFYGLADGSALAFFTFANTAVQEKLYGGGKSTNLYHHIALSVTETTQEEIRQRCELAGVKVRLINHGYCKSLYLSDPDGLLLEFALDPPEVAAINAYQVSTAHQTMAAWQSGERRSNNDWRVHSSATE